jgi:hypothetical protein
MPDVTTSYRHFQCPRCGMGDHEAGHLVDMNDEHCLICLEEDGLQIRLERWSEEPVQARFRGTLTVVATGSRAVA